MVLYSICTCTWVSVKYVCCWLQPKTTLMKLVRGNLKSKMSSWKKQNKLKDTIHLPRAESSWSAQIMLQWKSMSHVSRAAPLMVSELAQRFCSILSIPWSTFRVQLSLCRTDSGSVFSDCLWTPQVLCSHFLQARGKLKHLSLSQGEANKSLSLTARATEQEKALAWRVSDALPDHDEIYRERGWRMARKYVCGCACVAVLFSDEQRD